MLYIIDLIQEELVKDQESDFGNQCGGSGYFF